MLAFRRCKAGNLMARQSRRMMYTDTGDRGAQSFTGGRYMADEQKILQALDGLVAGFNAHDIDAIMDYFGEDCSLDLPRGPDPHGGRFVGREEVRRGILSRFETTPDVHYAEVENYVSGDTGMSKWLLTGTTLAGENIRVRGCDFYTFRDGKVTRKDSYWKIVV